MAKYTDSQLRSMTEAPWMWSDQLRKEAKRRKLAVTSVTPLTEVVSLLQTTLAAASHVFVPGKFQRGDRGGQWPEETCDVCGKDPRNVVHNSSKEKP